MSKAWVNGSTTAWRKLRAQVLLDNQVRNAGRCTVRGPRCTGRATVVHHTLGRAVTGDDPRYLAATCAPCNLAIGEPKADPPATPPTRW